MTSRRLMPRLARFSLLAVLGFVLTAQFVMADVIHLRTGEAVKGRPIIEESDDDSLAMHDFVSGAMRRFRWEAIDPADKEMLFEKFGWTNEAQGTVMGDVIEIELNDGSTDEIRGKVISETDTEVRILQNGQELVIKKSQIASRTEEEMDPREIWTPEQLWATYEEEDLTGKEMTGKAHLLAGQYAEWIFHLEKAKEHYESAAADPEFLQADVAKNRLERVEALIRDTDAREFLKQMRRWLALKNFRRVRAGVAEFARLHPDVTEVTTTALERLEAKYLQSRSEYFQNMARTKFPKLCEKLIEAKVKEDDITLTDATAWTRKDLPEAAFLALADAMGKRDDVTAEEAQAFWEQRKKSRWLARSYASGTFIVKPPQVKPPKSRPGGNNNRGGNRGGSGPQPRITIPKPPNRDQWWAQSKARDRTSWLMAYFAERSGLFELGEPKLTPCRVCNGSGLESKTLQTGATLSYICTRCAGTQQDVAVKFR